jgi:hypothetical protein
MPARKNIILFTEIMQSAPVRGLKFAGYPRPKNLGPVWIRGIYAKIVPYYLENKPDFFISRKTLIQP